MYNLQTKLIGNLLVDPPALTVCKNLHVKYNGDRLREHQLLNGQEVTLEVQPAQQSTV